MMRLMRCERDPRVGFIVGVIVCGLLSVPAVAQESEPEKRAQPERHEQQEPEEHEEHFHENELAFFLGVTHEAEAGDNLFTVGGEYGRKFTPRIGAAAAFEHLSDVNAWVFVFPVALRVYEGFHVSTGPGIEHLSRRSGGPEPEAPVEEDALHEAEGGDEGADNLFLWRVGVAYLFEFGERYVISADVAYDWVFEEHGTARAWVSGIKFAVGF